MQSLLDRNAIPKIRIKYFTLPEFNLDNSRKSRQQIFEHKGKLGSRVFEDPAFPKYLKYFIYGADLPWELKIDLEAAKSNAYYEDEFIENAYSVIKSYWRSFNGDKEALAGEIFKHTLDIGVDLLASKRLWEIVRTLD